MAQSTQAKAHHAAKKQARKHKPYRGDIHRRRRMHAQIVDCDLDRGTKMAVVTLLTFSDDQAKQVWPSQELLAKKLGCTPCTAQRYISNAEQAGLIKVQRFDPEHVYVCPCNPGHNKDCPEVGKVRRPHTNRYSFCVPPPSPNRQNPRSPRHISSDMQTVPLRGTSNKSLGNSSKTDTGQVGTTVQPPPFEPLGPDEPAAFSSRPPIDEWRAALKGRGRRK